MCVCALLSWIRKQWISVRFFVYKWNHSAPKRRRSADLRVSMQPRQRSSRHQQLRSTTCLRTALKSPVKCSKWCEFKKKKKKRRKERKKQSLPAIVAVYSFSSGFGESSKALLIITLTRHWHLSVGRVQILNILFQDKDLFDLHLNCKIHFFSFFFLEKKGKDWRCVLYPMKLTPLTTAKCWMQDVILCPVTCTVKNTSAHKDHVSFFSGCLKHTGVLAHCIIKYKDWILLNFGKSPKNAVHFAGNKGMTETLRQHMKQSNSELVPHPLGAAPTGVYYLQQDSELPETTNTSFFTSPHTF